MERLRQIEEIFQEALRRDPAERGAFVREACHGDTKLQREVLSLLANHQATSDSKPRAAAAAAKLTDNSASLEPGKCLGPYRIDSFLAAGGMGEVYRATDTRLHRQIAIKVSSARFTERFEREVRVIASLNHPNICQLHDVGPNYLVMELVEGPTLADRIKQGALPLDAALAIARQIAEALEAAHEKGIVHRDLKPANVKVTPDGVVKVLDFGLAKAAEEPITTGNASDLPTQTMSATRAGVILGTAAYMSPEQARGSPVDRRTDIWAFGVVLYNMLTGRPAFKGETVTDILAAVMKEQPDLEAVPARVRTAVARCLSKDPRNRWGSIGDVRWALEGAPTASAPSRSRLGSAGWIAAAALTLVAGATTLAWLHPAPAPPHTVTRLAMNMAAGVSNPALSRDGTRLAYAEVVPPRLWLRMMDQLEGNPIPGSDGGEYPAFSPDGQWLVYRKRSNAYQLMKIPVTGGAPVTLCDAEAAGSSWGDDGTILFGSTKGLMRVSAAGGRPESLTTTDAKNGEIFHAFPEHLPGGQTVLFTIRMRGDGRIAVLDLRNHTYRVVVDSGLEGRYVPSGHLVYLRGRTLFAAPFDVKRLSVTGPETPVVEGLNPTDGGSGTTKYTFSHTGVLAYWSGNRSLGEQQATTLAWMDREGVEQPLHEPPHLWGRFRLSPDGKRVATESGPSGRGSGDHRHIWIYDTDRTTWTPLTFEGDDSSPIWTPDGRWVTFSSNRAGKGGIYRVPADASGPPELLLATGAMAMPASWTPDGKTLLYVLLGQGVRIWLLPLPGSGGESKARLLFPDTPFPDQMPAVSPDGKWVAYASDQSGKLEIYVSPFPGPGPKHPISTHGGNFPKWSRDGRELFYYESPSRRLMAVEIQSESPFRADRPRPLKILTGGLTPFEVAPDGKRFLVVKRSATEPDPELSTTFVVVNDWFTDLLRRAPLKR